MFPEEKRWNIAGLCWGGGVAILNTLRDIELWLLCKRVVESMAQQALDLVQRQLCRRGIG